MARAWQVFHEVRPDIAGLLGTPGRGARSVRLAAEGGDVNSGDLRFGII